MTKIHFHINESLINELTWEEYEAFETAQEGEVKLSKLRPLLARFVVGADGKTTPHKTALKMLGALQLAKIKDVVKDFGEALKGATIPLEKGTPSNLPSQAETASESQPG